MAYRSSDTTADCIFHIPPKIDDKAHFELKDEFLKELRDNTFRGSDNEEENEHIEKVLKIVDLFHIPKVTQDQIMLRVFPMSLTGAASRWLKNKPSSSIITWETLKKKFLSKYCPPVRTAKKMEEINNFQQEPDETLYQAWERFKELLLRCPQHYLRDMKEVILFFKGLDVHTRQILDSNGAIPTMKAADDKKAMIVHLKKKEKHLKKHTTLNLEYHSPKEEDIDQLLQDSTKEIMEILRIKKPSIKALEIQIGQISKVLQERGSGSQPSSTKTNPIDHVSSILTTVKADTPSIHRIDHVRYVKIVMVELIDMKEASTNLKRSLMEKLRMRYQIEASINVHDSAILEDSLPLKEKDLGSFTIPCYINNICFEKALADLGASVSVMPYSTIINLDLGELAPTKLITELADKTIKRPKGIAKNVLLGIDKFVFLVDFVILDMPEDIKVLLILGRPFLSTAHAKIDVFKRKFCLKVGDDKIVFKSHKPTSNIIKRVFTLGPKERMELDLEARLMVEALILKRSLDPTYGDYIELNDLNEPLKLRRNQVEDLGTTIEEGEVIDEPIEDIVETRNDDNEISNGIDEYPSFYDFDKKIHINYAYNLQFSCMIVMENIDVYRDEGMGEVIVGKPFCRKVYVKARRFDGMITIYNGNDRLTYQMTRSHPRFKHLTNEQSNKMRPLLKVSAQDEMNGISHPYQKLKVSTRKS
ncbi:hypothetical protein Tco_0735608 [Tanacetum coccineum]